VSVVNVCSCSRPLICDEPCLCREISRLRARVAELEGALRDLCDEVEATAAAAVKARRVVKREVEP